MDETPQPNKPALSLERKDDFESRYANVTRYESNVFDLKVLFGEIDLGQTGKEIHRLHTGMTIPWSLVKLVIFYLNVNLILHEAQNGKVNIAPSQIPPRPPENVMGGQETETSRRASEAVQKLYADFMASL